MKKGEGIKDRPIPVEKKKEGGAPAAQVRRRRRAGEAAELALEGKKWTVEFQKGNPAPEITEDQVCRRARRRAGAAPRPLAAAAPPAAAVRSPPARPPPAQCEVKHSVYVYKCENSVLQVKGGDKITVDA